MQHPSSRSVFPPPRVPASGVIAIANHSSEISVTHRAGLLFGAAASRCHVLGVVRKLGPKCRGSRHRRSAQTMASANKRLVPTHTGEAPVFAAQAQR